MYGNDTYGMAEYGEKSQDTTHFEDSYIDLLNLLPEFYQSTKEMTELQTILGYKIGDVILTINAALEQCFILQATWGLERWEKIFGVAIDKSKSYERRREILLAKLRGFGTTTKAMIKNAAIAFSGGEVAILEYPEEYRFEVQFIGMKGIPQNMTGLIHAIEEWKPAHLTYSFKYTYTTWEHINALTWEGIKQKNWSELRIYEGA
ncbi:MAG: YmfQ family protein [Velocimicrobium sp.]